MFGQDGTAPVGAQINPLALAWAVPAARRVKGRLRLPPPPASGISSGIIVDKVDPSQVTSTSDADCHWLACGRVIESTFEPAFGSQS